MNTSAAGGPKINIDSMTAGEMLWLTKKPETVHGRYVASSNLLVCGLSNRVANDLLSTYTRPRLCAPFNQSLVVYTCMKET